MGNMSGAESRRSAGSVFLRGCQGSALLLAIVFAFAPLSRAAHAESPEAERLRAEIERQQQLLDQLQSGPAEEAAADPTALDPRAAPRTPQPRELPVAIFDEARRSIPAGTWGNARRLEVIARTLDADGDGRPELIRYVDPESQVLIREEADRDYDGVRDAFSDFEWGEVVRRAVDDDDDGILDGWERYANGRMTSREIDRNGDGVRDGFFEYAGDDLVAERYDSDDDGRIDREVRYRDRHRVLATEDSDHDGRVDVWFHYGLVGDDEVIVRIERDKQGRGRPDVFELFSATDGHAVLLRRDEDVDGDGEIDIVSSYRDGRLVRRELARAGLRPL